MVNDRNTAKPSRREFLTSATAATGVVLAGGLGIARTAHAAGSDELKIALIGCGGRGTGAAANCLALVRERQADRRGRRLRGQRRRAAWRICKKMPELAGKIDVPDDRVFVGFDAYQKAIAAGAGRRAAGHAAGLPPDPLRRGRRGRQARLHGEAVLRRRPRLPLADGDQQAGRREEPEGGRRPAAPPQQGVRRARSRGSTTARSAT